MTSHSIRLFCFTVLLIFFSHVCHAQRSFGVNWNIPDDPQHALEELRQMREMGITLLELQEQPAPRIWKEINSLQFRVYGHLAIHFPVATTFDEPDSTFIRSIEQNASAYLAQPTVQALGIFSYGAVHRPEFRKALSPYVNQIGAAGRDIYFVSSSVTTGTAFIGDFYIHDVRISPGNLSSFSAPDNPSIRAYRYSPQDNLKQFLSPLKTLVQETSSSPGKAIFLHSDWLFNIIDKYPSFEVTLRLLSTDSEAVFPVPNETLPEEQPLALPILLLIGVWGIIAILYHSSPIYRKSLFRYFLAHKFFIKDIFSRQIRSPIPALSIIFLNAVLMAASAYAVFDTLFTPLGQAGFFHYFPVIPTGPVPFIIGVFICGILLPLVSILWLFFSHRNIRSITQIAIIYAWPLQLNFITATVAITLYAASASSLWISFSTVVTTLILLLSFIPASMDAAKYTRKQASLYLALTTGIYVVLLAGLISWAFSGDLWWEVTDLLLRLK